MTNYKKSVIYVFSGTGNTLKIAQITHDFLVANTLETHIINLKESTKGIRDFNKDTLVYFMFPSHGFMPPWSVIKFLFRHPKIKKASAVCVSTRGALKAGPVTIPGIAGFATFLSAMILLLKGFKIKGLFSIDMPSNFINFHWGLNRKNVRKISDKGEEKTLTYLKKIVRGKSVFFTLNNLWELSWSLILFYFIPLFPVIYILIARLFMGKIMFANNNCNGCALCEKNCPSRAIIMSTRDNQKIPYWTDACDVCMKCMGTCKKKAIEASHLWLIILIIVTTIPVSKYLFGYFTDSSSLSTNTLDYINFLFVYPAILIMYRIFFLLTKYKWVNSLFTTLTLTHYFRRYYHPDIKIKNEKC